MTIKASTLLAMAAAAGAGLAASALPGGNVIAGTQAAFAQTTTSAAFPDPAKDRGATHTRTGTDAYAPRNWPRLRRTSYRYGRPGWSVAQDRRRAKKARNVARNRRAQRGGK